MKEAPIALDRIELLQTFVRIVESGSLSAAAQRLDTTQPTVSRRLQALERHFGVRLLRRSTHAATLTPDGERCLAMARSLIGGLLSSTFITLFVVPVVYALFHRKDAPR